VTSPWSRLVPTSPPVLATCDSEPIHLLGAIQPIGFLLSMNADWIVARASENIGAYLGVRHDRIIGRPVAACLPADILHDLRGRLQQSGQAAVVEPLFGWQIKPGGPLFAVAMHRSGDEIVLEFEEASGEACPAPTAVRAIIARVERHRSPAAIFREAARQVRAFNIWPVAATLWRGEQLRVWEAQPAHDTQIARAAAQPGDVLGLEGERLLVCCGEGVLGVTKLQLAGRRVLAASEFARARPLNGAHWG